MASVAGPRSAAPISSTWRRLVSGGSAAEPGALNARIDGCNAAAPQQVSASIQPAVTGWPV